MLAEILGCVLLTAFYWIPVLEQFADGTFYVSTNPAFETQDEMMTMLGIVSGRLSVSFAELGIFLLLVMLGLRSQIKIKGNSVPLPCSWFVTHRNTVVPMEINR